MSLIHHAATLGADLDRSERSYGDLLGFVPNGRVTLAPRAARRGHRALSCRYC